MPKWKIPMKHTRYVTIEIEASTLMAAMDEAEDWKSMALINDSQTEEFWELCPEDESEVREIFNDGQEDE